MKKGFFLIFIMFVVSLFTSCIFHDWWNTYEVTGIVTGDINGDGESEPIPGIQITATAFVENTNNPNTSISSTSEDGSFHFSWNPIGNPSYGYGIGKVQLIFEDIDGDENGEFKTITRTTDFSKENSSRKSHYAFDFGTINLSE